MKNNKRKMNRRNFLSRTFGAAGGLALGAGILSPQLVAAATNRRHLINITILGGWDSIWGHNGVSRRDLDGLTAAQWTDRYENYERKHPNGYSYLGPAMSAVTDDTLGKTLIWRGIRETGGGHNLSNRTLNMGSLSNYAASFASLMAQARALTTGAVLPLQGTPTSRLKFEG